MRRAAFAFLGRGHFVPPLLSLLALLAGPFGNERTAAASNVTPPSPAAPSAPTKRAAGRVVLEELTLRGFESPLTGLTPLQIQRLAVQDPVKLGAVSIGRPNRGGLWNPTPLVSGPGIQVMNDERCYGTPVAIESIHAAVAEVRQRYPDAPVLRVGDLSRERGGYLRPHRSHQSGLDVDVGYFYNSDERWYTRANAENLDREKTWALIKAFIAQGSVEYLFMDRSIQALLREHAIASGEAPDWVNGLFATAPRQEAIIRHTWGHSTHFHVRFSDARAEDTGRRVSRYLPKAPKGKALAKRAQTSAKRRR